MKKRTKIIATLGPASTSPSKIEGMLHAGADVFRINLSHASIDEAKDIISLVRSQEKRIGRPVAIMLDLQGQKVRIKGFGKKSHVTLKSGDKYVLDPSLNDNGNHRAVGVTFKDLYKKLFSILNIYLLDRKSLLPQAIIVSNPEIRVSR